MQTKSLQVSPGLQSDGFAQASPAPRNLAALVVGTGVEGSVERPHPAVNTTVHNTSNFGLLEITNQLKVEAAGK